MDRIAAINNKDQLVETIAYLQSLGVPALFGFGASPDLHNATMLIANVGQGGLGLPDRDYYLLDDPKSHETRQKYLSMWPKCLSCLATTKRPRKQKRRL